MVCGRSWESGAVAAGWSLSGAELIAEAERGQFVSVAGAFGRGVVCLQG
jgi:hypothetical protein